MLSFGIKARTNMSNMLFHCFLGLWILGLSSAKEHEQRVVNRNISKDGYIEWKLEDPPRNMTIQLRSSEELHFELIVLSKDDTLVLHESEVTSMTHNGTIISILEQTTTDYIQINPKEPIVAWKDGDDFEVLNLETNIVIGKTKFNGTVQYWNWLNSDIIAIVTDTFIYHWDIWKVDCPPKKVFKRHNRLTFSKVIRYATGLDLKWFAITGITHEESCNASRCSSNYSLQSENVTMETFYLIQGRKDSFTFACEEDFTILRVNKSEYSACNWKTAETEHISLDCSDIITEDILYPGDNYFVVNTTDGCLSGLRFIAVLLTNDCNFSNEFGTICSGNGLCVTNIPQTTLACRCQDAYYGKYCDETSLYEETPPQDSCLSTPCQNNGTCIQRNSSVSCFCVDSYTGAYCETFDPCLNDPCINGVCVVQRDRRKCYCTPGFHGEFCEKDFDECLIKPCKNGGTCVNLLDQYRCRCPHGYSGRNCSEKINLCKPNPCFNTSRCIDMGNTYRCKCRPGFSGPHCLTNINECRSNPCLHLGTCHDGINGYHCTCLEPHAGYNCEFTFDVFAPPIESEINNSSSKSYLHNLYIVSGSLMGAICIVIVVVITCYCRLHETYKRIRWKKLRSSESNLEVSSLNKARLSSDAIMEATSLTKDNQRSSSYNDILSTKLV